MQLPYMILAQKEQNIPRSFVITYDAHEVAQSMRNIPGLLCRSFAAEPPRHEASFGLLSEGGTPTSGKSNMHYRFIRLPESFVKESTYLSLLSSLSLPNVSL